jgi:hypothetical protein
MKKTPSPKTVKDLRAEYRFDYSKSRPNRFADTSDSSAVVVVLDPDVAEVFTTPESVNNALRALINAIPQPPKRKPARRSAS